MHTTTIAFDIDGTLRSNSVEQTTAPVPNEDIRSLLILLSRFKNVRIVAWSGSGEIYARQVVASFGLASYVDSYASKNHLGVGASGVHQFAPDLTPDIAIDDIQTCELGLLNLIVRQK